jgi:ArsR family transcriptional regulator
LLIIKNWYQEDKMSEIDDLLNEEKNLEKATKALKAMAHPLRLKILCVLNKGEMTVLDVVAAVGSSQSNISQHLDILRSKEIVSSRRDGNKVLCKVKDERVLAMVATMKNLFCESSVVV